MKLATIVDLPSTRRLMMSGKVSGKAFKKVFSPLIFNFAANCSGISLV